ncbi:Glutamyl-tRNA reductase [bacterium HR17]|uniref:Glutamyl-tRNA reductase n=1 Tax=Candidatus Fervidibacter japonicus TaxID=2035412 RepID=A0A2H5XAK8_9BACT|nr:Glutamyl-tRNA reductase [bacterium HR17]
MRLLVVGINHKVAPVEVREKVAFADEQLPAAYEHFRRRGAAEVVLLSTCNRSEVYIAVEGPLSERELVAWWTAFFGLPADELAERFYAYRDHEAARHLFRVACGLDSMMLGETQILGQVKGALETAQRFNAVGAYLGELFRRAIKVGKRARTDTAISKGAMSVGGAAVELARRIFADLRTCTVLLIGAGKMGTDTAKALVQAGAKQLLVCNRTLARAQELAQRLSGQVVPFERLNEQLAYADIVVASTAATRFVLTQPMVAEAVRRRRYRPLFLIDIAVPRNIEPTVGDLDSVFLFDIDDLEQVVQEFLEERRKEVPKVEALIESELRHFAVWLGERKAKPLIVQLLQDAQKQTEQAMRELVDELPDLTEAQRNAVAAKMRALAMRLLSRPLNQLKRLAHTDGILEVAHRLFVSDESSPSETKSQAE